MNRMIQLDMLRGYALMSIMFNHMPMSVMRDATLSNFAIYDAAELFVLLSGFLVGLVWQTTVTRNGLRTAQKRFAWRAFEVWRALVVGGVVMALLSAWLWSFDMRHTAIWSAYAKWVIDMPLGYVGTLAVLWMQPNLIDVLAVYVVLLFSVPLLVPLMTRWPLMFAIGSLTVWWFAKDLNPFIPNQNTGRGMLFNPFGWQMLFYAGVAMGVFRKQLLKRLLPWSLPLTILCGAITLFGFLHAMERSLGTDWRPMRELLAQFHSPIDKWRLDGVRFVSIMAASWLAAVPFERLLRWAAATPAGLTLREIGRGGLWSFIFCVLLSILGDALQLNPKDQGMWSRLAIDIWVIAALWLASITWHNLLIRFPKQQSAR